ncbi:MAG TPA: hypothetical protein PKK26_16875 [Candidatus Wallbacteria bacterium]|nr:hypothetical protein [Candidatus Wallbacteria bacterium]
MKKNLLLLTVLVALTMFSTNVFASDSCSSCPNAGVCESAKSGESCGQTQDAAKAPQPAAISAKTAEVNLEADKNIDIKTVTASTSRGAKSFIIKLNGKKEALDGISAAFAKKFDIKENKGADLELVKVASGLWIKITNGAEAEKLQYLKSLGINAVEEKK